MISNVSFFSLQAWCSNNELNAKFDQEVNYKGRAGYNDVGLPISPKTITQKNKNRARLSNNIKKHRGDNTFEPKLV